MRTIRSHKHVPSHGASTSSSSSGHHQEPSGGALSRMITNNIMACNRLQDLEDVYNEWGSSFSTINAAAAMNKCAKLSRKGSGTALFKRLAAVWLRVLPDAEEQQCANVLWAYARLGARYQLLWDPTLEATCIYCSGTSAQVMMPT